MFGAIICLYFVIGTLGVLVYHRFFNKNDTAETFEVVLGILFWPCHVLIGCIVKGTSILKTWFEKLTGKKLTDNSRG